MGFHEYQVIGRARPTETNPAPKIYRMKIFAPTHVHAKSRFWYFLSNQHKLKRSSGEILAVNEIFEKKPLKVKNFGVVLRYNSRSGTHNLYKEFRDVTRNGAIEQLYMDMAARHRAHPTTIQILDLKEITAGAAKRPNLQQFHDSKVKFPLPRRALRVPFKKYKTRFQAHRPRTHF